MSEKQPKKRKAKKKNKGLKVLLTLLIVVGVIAVGVNAYINSLYNEGEAVPDKFVTPEDVKDDIVNILVCGIDNEEGREEMLTDVIVYVTLDTVNNTISALQIQRDIFMGHDVPGTGKINGAYSNGDESEPIFNTIQVLNEKLGLPVDHYVTLDMEAFIDVVNALETEIEMYVPYPVILINKETGEDEILYAEPGTYLMDGATAELVVRNRNYTGSADTKRAEVQGYFYTALIQYFIEDLGIEDFYNIMNRFTSRITTDMEWTRIYSLANFAFNVPYENMTLITPTVHGGLYETAPGTSYDSIAILEIVPSEWETILNEHFLFYAPTTVSKLEEIGKWTDGPLIQDYGIVPTEIRTISEMVSNAG